MMKSTGQGMEMRKEATTEEHGKLTRQAHAGKEWIAEENGEVKEATRNGQAEVETSGKEKTTASGATGDRAIGKGTKEEERGITWTLGKETPSKDNTGKWRRILRR